MKEKYTKQLSDILLGVFQCTIFVVSIQFKSILRNACEFHSHEHGQRIYSSAHKLGKAGGKNLTKFWATHSFRVTKKASDPTGRLPILREIQS